VSTNANHDILADPVRLHVKEDFVSLPASSSVQDALALIRSRNLPPGHLVYFYVQEEDGRLCGVVQTRMLLTAPLDQRISAVMSTRLVTIPEDRSMLDAGEMFIEHRFLALPVVDAQGRMTGVIDIRLFSGDILELEERGQAATVFETLGVRLSDSRATSEWEVFRSRFPWLLATIASGTTCALLVGLFEVTLASSLVLAFFLTLVLGLGESISMQTMAVIVHAFNHRSPRRGWTTLTLRRELWRTFLLGCACATIVGLIALAWKRELLPALVIAGGILGSLLTGCAIGVCVPAVVHKLKLDLRVASGPLTLALTDICTILIYFSLATVLLR
jgi:magnesium transporter